MEYVIVGLGSVLALGTSDGIESTDWYADNFYKPNAQNVNTEQWYGYGFRYAVGGAIVLASLALASAVAK